MEKGVPSLLIKLQMGGTTLLCRKRVARVPAGQPLRSIRHARQVWVPGSRLGVSRLQIGAGSSRVLTVADQQQCQEAGDCQLHVFLSLLLGGTETRQQNASCLAAGKTSVPPLQLWEP